MAGNWVQGEWRVGRGYNGHQLTIEMPDERGTLAWLSVPTDPVNEPQWEASARLIAAAPDGFAAAESAYRLLLRVPHDLPLRFLNQPVYAALLDYIAKARGEEEQTVQDRYEAEARGDQPDSDPPIPNSATPQGA